MTGRANSNARVRTALSLCTRILIVVLTLAGVVAAAANVDAASVSLTWNAPTTNSSGTPLTDLANYRVYLATAAPSCPSASFLTVSSPTSTPPAGQIVASRVTALSAGTTYFARITAVDSAGNESSCSPSASGLAQVDFSVTPTASTDFGSVTVGGQADRSFTVQNTSTASISGTTSVGAPYSVVAGGSFTLAAGASQVVTVRFRPTGAGTFAGNVNVVVGGDTLSRGVTGAAAAVPMVSLSVTRGGTGAGAVTSAPTGIACGATCTASVPVGTPMTLTAAATSGSTFVNWGGACSGTAASCAWTMNVNTTVTATFNTTRVDVPLAGVPVVSSLAPASAPAGSGATTLTVNGSGFAPTSVVRWNGVTRSTTVDSATQLRAALTAADLATPRSVLVSVVTPAPGGGTSGTLSFTVDAVSPAPVASSLSPASANAGSTGVTLTVNGSKFVASSVVRWNGAPRTTTYMSASRLRVALAASDLVTAGSVPVSVATPAPGGGTSGTMSFTIKPPSGVPVPPVPGVTPGAPAQLSVTPLGTDASGATFGLAWGAGSGATSYRYVAAFSDGTASQQGTVTGLVSLQLRMPYHVSGAARGGFVCVRSVGSTGLQSTDQSCNILTVPARPPVPAVPTAGTLSPPTAVAGSAGFTLTVNGSGFVDLSVVRWNGTPRTTRFVSATQLQIDIAASDLATSGSVPVSVSTPAPGGGVSGIVGFAVTAPPVPPVPPVPSAPPAAPVSPSVTRLGLDAGGATFAVAWGGASGATSYRYVAAFADGSAAQQGTVTGLSLQLRMPYYRSGAASGGFVCLRSVNAAGQQSTDQACNALQVPAR